MLMLIKDRYVNKDYKTIIMVALTSVLGAGLAYNIIFHHAYKQLYVTSHDFRCSVIYVD